jgi:Fic family protein
LKNGKKKGKKQRNVAKVRHLSSTTCTRTKRKKEKGILKKSIAQPNPKFNLSKCVASWTQSNYTFTRAFFRRVVVTLKFTPIKNFLLHLFHLVQNHLKTLQVKH